LSMDMATMAIVKGDEPVDMVIEALGLIEAEKAFSREERILVKPNYINASHPSTGNTTDARVIEGAIEFLKEEGYSNIAIGEGSGLSDTMRAYEVAGVDEVARRCGVELIDLNEDEYVVIDVPNHLALKKVRISQIALDSAIVSVPKLKLHRMSGVTLTLKNLMGVVQPKGQIHLHLSEKIADLASVVRPRLSVVDGIIGGEGYETAGKPVKMDLVIAGLDPVSVDTVGATIMGFDPMKAKHIPLAAEKGLGISDMERIKIVGERISDVKKDFRQSFSSRFMSRFA
jgi:uncharacterized protein (DUF362 family)